MDLYQVYISGWHTGREGPFTIYGPQGIVDYFETILKAYEKELSNRIKWEKRPNEKGLEYEVVEIDRKNLDYSKQHAIQIGVWNLDSKSLLKCKILMRFRFKLDSISK